MPRSRKKKGRPAQRCPGCSRSLTNLFITCPDCNRRYCEECATTGTTGGPGHVPFIHCQSDKCYKFACFDCAFSGHPNPPMLMCGNCSEILCFDCATWDTEGQNGHDMCIECTKMRCFKCTMEDIGGPDFITPCWGCGMTFCMKCYPDPFVSCCSKCLNVEHSSSQQGTPKTNKKTCANPDCPNDGASGAATKKCADCRSVRFCSVECQAIMWPEHKAECKKKKKKLMDATTTQGSTKKNKTCANPKCPNDASGAATQKCAGCQTVYFCSKECQTIMWPEHKVECKVLKEKLKEKRTR